MDRRTLLKSSAALFGALSLSGPLGLARAQAEPVHPRVAPDAAHPLALNFNENALGMSPLAQQAIVAALPAAFRYPDAAREALIAALAERWTLTPEHISLGNGSSECIQAVLQSQAIAAQRQGKAVQLVVPDPTFNYAELYLRPLGVEVVKVPLDAQLAFPLVEMQRRTRAFKGVSLVYLCNPNNPTATITPADQLAAWISQAPPDTFFVIDEAYAEFVSDPAFRSAIELVQAGHENLLVTRTFSKLYALAGLRVGYGVAQPGVAAQSEALMSLDNTNTAGAVAALASLQDRDFVEQSRKNTDLARQIVCTALDELQLAYLPSQANFVFHRVTGDVADYQARMKQHHILVGRPFPPLTNWNRLTLGTPQEMQLFVTQLHAFRRQGWV
ncbi:aminotransferase class I [Edwardsiella hoshinae]|uniref:Aminotransferase class I n=1 Tax=Edwardsiella hoshinae TaxID=93378 RepID=A0A376DLF4_9GAMM|nr:aminotransferase class I/II-fold pyridoxal phosphate-dependent enzyme [Edwardsiella hoshinae]AOV98033.1 aminotransferase class I [Edwardsiella hoshinae]QPR29087.1 aminotransferase class I/II-fold pyridoxal phosphate-dependent enzyme [Edwardsiella hoshinae]STC91452.1 Putative phenylalanine aminotransferase [Edwardsiella hoshinae]